MPRTDLEIAEWELWEQYTDGMDALHREATRIDQTGRMGYVYLAEMDIIGHVDSRAYAHVKIGRARNPSQRIRDWSRTSVKMPYRIREVHSFWCEDAALTERFLHNYLAEHREAGEWFWLPFDIQHAFYGLWYISSYDDNGPKLYFRGVSGGWYEPEEFFESELRDYHRQGEIQRAARAAKEAREADGSS